MYAEKILRRFNYRSAAPLLAFVVVVAHSQDRSESPKMDWPEATARLTELRSRAETCVALRKAYGKPNEVAQGRLIYSDAKAKIDGAIIGLITALATNSRPETMTTLQSRIDAGSTGLVAFCDSTSKLVPSIQGERGVSTADIVKGAMEPMIKTVSAAVSALYNNHRKDREVIRRTIQTQLEAAKWPAFDAVARAE